MRILGRLERRHGVLHRSNGAGGHLHADPRDVHLGEHQLRRAQHGLVPQLLVDVHALLGGRGRLALGVAELGRDDHLQRAGHALLVARLLGERQSRLCRGQGIGGLQRGHTGLCQQQLRSRLTLGIPGRREDLHGVLRHFAGLWVLLVDKLSGNHAPVNVHLAINVLEVLVDGQRLTCLLQRLGTVRGVLRQQLGNLCIQCGCLVRHGLDDS
mmetsp:Transcript_94854/g.277327  ORF Transcript_94854/g.277327 Transcript_94854/m.277327 type:complete len:212 (+) Transcript_94854:958-1593(+)